MRIIYFRNKYTMIVFKILKKILPQKFSINLKTISHFLAYKHFHIVYVFHNK